MTILTHFGELPAAIAIHLRSKLAIQPWLKEGLGAAVALPAPVAGPLLTSRVSTPLSYSLVLTETEERKLCNKDRGGMGEVTEA